jgi:hypothetical protein
VSSSRISKSLITVLFLESEQMAGKTVKAQFFLMMLKKLLLLKKKCTSSTLARGSYC